MEPSNPPVTYHYQPWSAADDAQLRKYALANYPARDIGTILGRTKDAVIAHAHRVGVKLLHQGNGIPWSPVEDAFLRSEARAGQTAAYISNTLGRTKDSVIGRSHRIGAKLLRRADGAASAAMRKQNAKARLARRKANFAALGFFQDDC